MGAIDISTVGTVPAYCPPAGPLAGPPGVAFRMAFREWFGMPPTAADLLAKLYLAAGGFVTAAELSRAVGALPGAMRYHLYQVRQAMDCEAVDSQPSYGYRLSEVGLAECRTAIRTIGEELMEAV